MIMLQKFNPSQRIGAFRQEMSSDQSYETKISWTDYFNILLERKRQMEDS